MKASVKFSKLPLTKTPMISNHHAVFVMAYKEWEGHCHLLLLMTSRGAVSQYSVFGGIGFNQENSAALFYDNLIMGAQLMHIGYEKELTNSLPSE